MTVKSGLVAAVGGVHVRSVAVVFCLLTLPALLSTGCRETGSKSGIVSRDSAGVRIVQSTGPDRALDCRFTELFRLGGADAGPESFYQIEPRGIAVGRDGNIYVLDRGNHRVLTFSAAGEYVRSSGSRGGGPGELGAPVALALEPDGAVSVLDYTKRGLTRFARDGSALSGRRIELMYTGERMAYTSEGLLLDVADGYRSEQETVFDNLVRLDPDGEVQTIASLARPRPNLIKYTGCVAIAFNPLFAPELSWDANGEVIAVSSTVEYEVDVYRGLKKVASYRRDLPPRAVSRKTALSELGRGKAVVTPQGKCTIDPEEELTGRGYAEVLPTIDEVAVAPDGGIWVRRSRLRGEDRLIDILDPAGGYLGTLQAGSPFPAAFLAADALIVRETDDLDIEYLVAYSIDCRP